MATLGERGWRPSTLGLGHSGLHPDHRDVDAAKESAANAFTGDNTFTGVNTFGTGDNVEVRDNPTVRVGQEVNLHTGTIAAPDTSAHPSIKITRHGSTTAALWDAETGNPNGQTINGGVALSVVATNPVDGELQATAGYFGASTDSTFVNPDPGEPDRHDAGGLMAEGWVKSGTGTANAATLVGRREVDTGRACAVEMHVQNNTPTAGVYSPEGTSDVKGMFISCDGDAPAASAIEITRQGDQPFLVGIGFGEKPAVGSAVTQSTIRDAGSATTSLDIQGTHTRALGIAAGAGNIKITSTNDTDVAFSSAVSGDVANSRLNIRADGRLDWFEADGTGQVTMRQAGTAGGSLLVSPRLLIDGDLDHDGDNVGFYSTTPTTKQTVTGSRGSNAALASLLTALAAYGLVTDSSS